MTLNQKKEDHENEEVNKEETKEKMKRKNEKKNERKNCKEKNSFFLSRKKQNSHLQFPQENPSVAFSGCPKSPRV